MTAATLPQGRCGFGHAPAGTVGGSAYRARVRYSDAQLADAVSGAHSWRGVLRRLGLPAHSSSALRTARTRAAELGLDVAHFTGQRRWTDDQLATAIRAGRSWAEVLDQLGLARTSGSARASLKAHAARLNLAVGHLDEGSATRSAVPTAGPAGVTHLNRAGPLLAASWFALRGYDVAWPLEPARFDLIVTRGGEVLRVQVKTTTSKANGSWVVRISSNRPSGTVVYTPDEVDHFFVVDGDLTCYLIPLRIVGGFQVIYLRRYTAFALPGWLGAA